MKKTFAFALAGLTLAGAGSAYAGSTLYDNQPNTVPPPNAVVNQEFGPPNEAFDAFLVDDVTFGADVTIDSVSVYLTEGNDWSGVTQARLNIFAGSGALPGAGDDPAGGTVVTVAVSGFGSGIQTMTASGLGLNLTAGEYWIGLTPIADFGVFGQNFHFPGLDANGDGAAIRNPGGGFGLPAGSDWGAAGDVTPEYVDASMTITGIIPAPGAVALLGLAGFAARRRRRG